MRKPEPVPHDLERLFVQDALMRRTLVQNHQARPDLGEDVPVMQLPDTIALIAQLCYVLLRRIDT